jgi:lipoprotein-anchoring transpeptidase ErfK/SrfK
MSMLVVLAPALVGLSSAPPVHEPPATASDPGLVEPAGFGPMAAVELNASTTADGAVTVAHLRAERMLARTAPDPDAEVVAAFTRSDRPGSELVFMVTGPVVDGWVEVQLPVRPNGTTGWIRAEKVDFTTNPYRINVDLEGFELTITRDGHHVLTTTIAVGTGSTPTPHGEFYLTELLRPSDPDGLYGPYAYGVSGFSDTLASFNGGPGVIGIHGTDQPERLGGTVSHGCIRVDNAVITRMASFLPLGTPVTIS